MKNILRFALFSLTALMALMAFHIPGYALSINIDPSKAYIVLKPGETKTGDILVQNFGGASIKVKAYAEDWIYAPDGSKTFMKSGSSVYSCSSWITLDSDIVELAPKESKKVSYTIAAPGNTSGGHVSVIFFESMIEKYEGIAVSGRIGTIIFQDTDGDIKRSGEINELSILTSEEGKPINLSFSFVNKGNSHVSAKPTIKIFDGNDLVIETQEKNINTLPGDTKVSNVVVNKTLKEGDYKAEVEINFEDKTLKSESNFTIRKPSE